MDGDTQRLKKSFLSALAAGRPAAWEEEGDSDRERDDGAGEGGGMTVQSFSSGPAREGPATFIHDFFFYNSAVLREASESGAARIGSNMARSPHREKAMIDRTRKKKRRIFPQKNTFRMIY